METQHDSGGGRIRPPFRFETPNFDLFITTNRFLQKERSAMTASTGPRYKRVLLKLSGESFARPGESGISVSEVQVICEQIKRVVESGVQLAIVCGGGNILRGREFSSTNSIVAPALTTWECWRQPLTHWPCKM
jgi:hypothetical protein